MSTFLVCVGLGLATGLWLMMTLGILVAWRMASLNELPSGISRDRVLLLMHCLWLYAIGGVVPGCLIGVLIWFGRLYGDIALPAMVCGVVTVAAILASAAAVFRLLTHVLASRDVLALYCLVLMATALPVVAIASAVDDGAAAWAPGGAWGLVSAITLVSTGAATFTWLYRRPMIHPEGVRIDLNKLMQVRAGAKKPVGKHTVSEPKSYAGNHTKTLLIGWDGATWRIIRPMFEKGQLPNLRGLVERGSSGVLQTYKPPLSPLIWTSIATGCLPSKHGVKDFTTWRFPGVKTHIAELAGGVGAMKLMRWLVPGWEAPISSDAVKCPTIGQILSYMQKVVGTVGWWGSWPAQELNGFVVSDRVVYTPSNLGTSDLSSLKGLTYPDWLYDEIKVMLRNPDSITLEEAQEFMNVQHLKPGFRKPYDPEHLFKIALATTESFHKVGLYLYKKFNPDFFAVYFQGIDFVSHFMWQYAYPDSFPDVSEQDIHAYGEVIQRFYAYQDRILGEFLALRDDHTNVFVVSDHGFDADLAPFVPLHTGRHDLEGIFVADGYGVRQGVNCNMTPADVAPTLLALMGVTVSEDMDGRVLNEIIEPAFLEEFPVQYVSSYPRTVTGRGLQRDASMEQEMIKRLRSLGYID